DVSVYFFFTSFTSSVALSLIPENIFAIAPTVPATSERFDGMIIVLFFFLDLFDNRRMNHLPAWRKSIQSNVQ
ncbi:MAG: hypothetical protein AB1728_12865, partial [Bacteroidota bacterium]